MLNLRDNRLVTKKLLFKLHKNRAIKKVLIIVLALEYILAEKIDALDNSLYFNVNYSRFLEVEDLVA